MDRRYPLLLSILASVAVAAGASNGTGSSFGTASTFIITPAPCVLLQHSCPSTGGMITFSYFQSADLLWAAFDDVLINIYVDGESPAAIQFPLGFFDEGDLVPYGQTLVGSTAYAGGLYFTIRIPFQSSINVTAQLGPSDSGTHNLRVIMRGACGLSLTSFGGVAPPAGTRAKLRTQFINAQTFQSLQAVPLAASTQAGMLVMLGLKGSSTNMSFTHGEVNATIDGSLVPLGYDLAGFLAADDSFATGKFTTPISGVTAYADVLSNEIIAWRAFDLDLVVWSDSMSLSWGIGAASAGAAGPTIVTAVTWWYEWLPT